MRTRGHLFAAAAAVLAMGLAACGSTSSTAGVSVSTSAAQTSSGASVPTASGSATDSGSHLRIGISFDEPGLGIRNSDGTFSGFDVQTALYVAGKLGVSRDNITFVEATTSTRELLLTTNQVDLVVNTYSITDERKQKVDFAGPYFVAHQDLLIRRNDEALTSVDFLGDRQLCTTPGSTSAQLVQEKYNAGVRLTEYPTYTDCVAALMSGAVDAVTTDDVILAGYASEPKYKGALRVVGKSLSTEQYGIGIHKGDTDMKTKVNAALKDYISDGSWKKALDSTVAASGYSIPSPPTPGTA